MGEEGGAVLAAYAVLRARLPGRGLEPLGILLVDASSNSLHLRLRRDWEQIAAEDDREVLELLDTDLRKDAARIGAAEVLAGLEDRLSNTLEISDPAEVEVDDFDLAVNRLYRRHVQTNVVPFRTHLPLYSLRVAAGKFLENEEVTEESWLEAPENLRLGNDMFVARIAGHSMEPLIPDGALCVFRHGVAGSRQGRLVLVENLETGGNNRYTVKRYRSEKARSDESGESWKHARIRLESLNPEYPSWDLDPDQEKYRIVAEFVRVLE